MGNEMETLRGEYNEFQHKFHMEMQQRIKELEEQLFDVQLDMDQLQIQHSEEVAALQETIDKSEKESTKKTKLKDNEIVQLKSKLEQLYKHKEGILASSTSQQEIKLAENEAELL